MRVLINTVSTLQADINSMRTSSYENVTWTNTSGSTWKDPLRHYPNSYNLDLISKTAIKTTTGTGT